jgi:hypothetical protein
MAFMQRSAIGDDRYPPRLPSPSHSSVVLNLAPGQIEILRRIDPACAAKLVGNASERGNVSALDLSAGARPLCLLLAAAAVQIRQGDALRREDSAANTVVIARAIGLKQTGVNLLRVDQNFGGARTLIRYAVVSVVLDRTTHTILLMRDLLPASVESDAAAIEYGNARIY